MLKKWMAAILSGVMIVGGVVGCGSKDTSSETNSTKKESKKENKEGETLRFLDVSPRPERQKNFEDNFAKFEEETGIKVKYESVPWDEAANKLTIMAASNTLPDVFTMPAIWEGQFIPAGWIIPLTDYIDGSGNKDKYSEFIKNILWNQQEEKFKDIYSVPDGLMAKGVFVRKDWFEEEGIPLDENWTWDDFFEVAKQITDPASNKYALSFRGARGAFDPLMYYLQSFTAGKAYDDTGEMLLDDVQSVKNFEKWCSIYTEGLAPKESVNWGFVEMVDNFTGGLTAMLINDSEVTATCEANMQPEQWTVLPIPRSDVDNKIYNTANSPYSFVISSHSKQPDAAWKLIDFMCRPDVNLEYCKVNGVLPVRSDIPEDPIFGEDGPYGVFIKQLNDPDLVVPTDFGPFDITDLHQGPMHEEIQKYLLGQQDSKTSLTNVTNELEKRMKAYLAENTENKVPQPASMK